MERRTILIALLFSFLGLAALAAGYAFHQNFTYPAYMSYVAECVPDGQEIIAERGYVQTGRTIISYDNGTISNITVQIAPGAPAEITAHEYCHVDQALRGGLYGCEQPVMRYLNELECYLKA